MKMIRLFTLLTWCILATNLSLCAQTLRLYSVGNSLTWDSKPPIVADTLQAGGLSVAQGYHITCGLSLAKIVADPTNTCIFPPAAFGVWTNALANFEWDVITLQAFPGTTGSSEIAAAKTLIETALAGGRNRNCRFYLLFAWPAQSKTETFAQQMNREFAGANAKVFLSHSFLDYWFAEMVTAFPELDIRVIPTGRVFATIDDKLREVNIATFTNTYALYRDSYHMKPEGQHVAAMSFLSAVSGIRPDEQRYSPTYSAVVRSMDANLVDLVHEVVWSTLACDPRTKVACSPFISVRFNKLGNLHECSFVGRLHRSLDLSEWTRLDGAQSPYRVTDSERAQFFRVDLP